MPESNCGITRCWWQEGQANAFSTGLKLIWPRSSLKTTKMCTERIFAKSSRSQWVKPVYMARLSSQYSNLLYGSVSQGLGTTKSTNLIGWNGYWPRSRFSHLDRHLDRKCFEVKKLQTKMQNHWLFSSNNVYSCQWQKADEKKKVKRTSKIWKNKIRLVAVRKQNVS